MAICELDFVGFDIFVIKLRVSIVKELFAKGTLEIAELDYCNFGVLVTNRC